VITGLGDEDVVETRLHELQRLDRDPGVIQRPNHWGDLGGTSHELDQDLAVLCGQQLSETADDPVRAFGDLLGQAELEVGASDLRLQRLRRVLGDELAVVEEVVELAPVETPGKGEVIRRMARDRELRGALYAGDDRADLEAFAALDELRGAGLTTLKVAARTSETPPELVAAADIVVDGPQGVVAVLEALASPA